MRHASSEKVMDTSDDALLSSPPTSPNTYMNLEEMELQIEKLNRELGRIILNGAKSRVDLDLIEGKSEERRKLKNTIKQMKRQVRPGYQSIKLRAVRSIEVYRRMKKQVCMKPRQ